MGSGFKIGTIKTIAWHKKRVFNALWPYSVGSEAATESRMRLTAWLLKGAAHLCLYLCVFYMFLATYGKKMRMRCKRVCQKPARCAKLALLALPMVV